MINKKMLHAYRIRNLFYILFIVILILFLLDFPFPTEQLFTDERTRIKSANILENNNVENPVSNMSMFVYNSSYILRNENGGILRLIVFHHCENKLGIEIKIDQNKPLMAKSTVINNGCPWFHKKCMWDGFYVDVAVTNSFSVNQSISIRTISPDKNWTGAPFVRLSQPTIINNSPERPHLLAVCVSVLHYYADWIQLAQFLEIWVQLGATKFYIYAGSVLPEVKLVLDMYIEQGLVELVIWPPLPKSQNEDPNLNIRYGGQITLMNECNHKARSNAKFVAHVDLDELLIPTVHASWTTLLPKPLQEKPNSCSFLLRNSYVFGEMYKVMEMNDHSTGDIDFTYLTEMKESKPGGFSYTPKSIVIPDRVYRMHVHEVLTPVKGYESTRIDVDQAKIYHVKFEKRNIYLTSLPSDRKQNILTLTTRATEAWKKRIRGYLPDKLSYGVVDIRQQLRLCIDQQSRVRKSKCLNLAECESMVHHTNLIHYGNSRDTWKQLN